jgi:hypothetical protein
LLRSICSAARHSGQMNAPGFTISPRDAPRTPAASREASLLLELKRHA